MAEETASKIPRPSSAARAVEFGRESGYNRGREFLRPAACQSLIIGMYRIEAGPEGRQKGGGGFERGSL